jgi:seryl-tRNA synthetase
MHDLRLIRDDPEAFDHALARRGMPPQAGRILELDAQRRTAQTAFQEAQQRRNAASKEIGAARQKGQDASALMAEVAELKERIARAETGERTLGQELNDLLARLPNAPAADVPEGADEKANVELRRVGSPPSLSHPQEHFELGEKLGMMDASTAATMSGARFTVLRGPLARLERALAQFMLDLHTSAHGYTEVSPPLMVRDNAVFGTGQLPKFAEDLFQTTSGHWLIPTAEVPLTNLVNGQILDSEILPLRLTALTPCFRAEAGAAGKDTRGMIRQHQFWKVELVSITSPEHSAAEHERMTECAETILRQLELPYRTIVLCTGDMGFSAQKTYDIEVWLPGQNTYREISSCSTCGDFQARRMNARCRPRGSRESTRFVHTLNGSGVAVGRALIAVMENYQQPNGDIAIPAVLQPYMGGQTRISRNG